jgi:hypothetical protein
MGRHFQEKASTQRSTLCRKNISKKGPLTDDKGEGDASGTIVAEQEPLFITGP